MTGDSATARSAGGACACAGRGCAGVALPSGSAWPPRPPSRLPRLAAPIDGWSMLRGGRLARRALALLAAAHPLCAGWRLWPAAALAGTLPLAIALATGVPGQHAVSGCLLAPLVLALLATGRFARAVAAMLLAFACHIPLAVAASARMPDRAAAVMPTGRDYWRDTEGWLRTGVDPHYEARVWLPEHGWLACGVTVTAAATFGAIPFVEGFRQVDQMDYYVGRLLVRSRRPVVTVLLGWHPWSLTRGIAYALLIATVAGWALSRVTGLALAPPGAWTRRLALAIALIVLDGVVKFTCAEAVRAVLGGNLI